MLEEIQTYPDLDTIFKYIIDYKRQMDGNSPTVRQIADALDLPSSSVHINLQELERRQLIRRIPYTRQLCIANGRWTWGEETHHATRAVA